MTPYNNFGSKDELVAAYLARRHESWERHLRAHLHRAGAATARLLAVFDAYTESASEPGHRGCGFLNAAAGAEAPDTLAEQLIGSSLH